MKVSIFVVLLISAGVLFADSLEFQPAVNYLAGTSPSGIGAGDFNRDGKPDIVVANSGSANVSVLNGNGTGGFGAATNYGVGSNPHGVLVADFNRDHKDDIAVANFADGTVTVLINGGVGVFNPAGGSPFAVQTGPEGLATADFNFDGILDLGVTNSGSGTVSILLGTGTGSFGAAINTPTAGSDPRGITIADFNRDGGPDLAVANAGSGNVRVMLGDGLGGFPAGATVPVGSSPRSVAAGDFNLDGELDFVAANNGSSDLDLAYGNGAGAFSSGGVFPAGSAPEAVIAGDFNSDGRLDIAIANSSVNSATFLPGTPGGFTAPITFSAGSVPLSITAADFNFDGSLDAALSANGTNAATALISISGAGDTLCYSGPTTVVTGTNPEYIATGDFNFDGNVDLAVSNFGSENISILFGDGLGGFTKDTDLYGPPYWPYGLAAGDLDRDGDLDLAVGDVYLPGITTLLGSPDGSFSWLSYGPFAGQYPFSVGLGDMNRDGILDVVSAARDDSQLYVFLGLGNGFLQDPGSTSATGTYPWAVAIADLNRDGKLDVATANLTGNNATVKLGDGNGGFTSSTNQAAGTNPLGVTFADFNADGRLDLAIANYTSSDVTVKIGNGTGGFSSSANHAVAMGPSSVQAADMNSDGRVDLVAASYDANAVSILLGNGAGGFAPYVSFPMGSGARTVALLDVNHDGKTDILTTNELEGTVSIRTLTPEAVNFTVSAPTTVAAGIPFNVTVTAKDACGNISTSYTGTVRFTSSDPLALLPPDTSFSPTDNGVKTFSVTLGTTGGQTVVATDTVVGSITGFAFPMVRQFTNLQILLPGEAAAPGTPTGKTGTPTTQMAGIPFNVTVNAVDPNWYRITAITDFVVVTSTDPNATLNAGALVGGLRTLQVTLNTAGSWTLTASDFTDGSILSDTSPNVSVTPGPFVKLQLLVPGETAAPGTPTGKTGTPLAQVAGAPFSVTVNAVDLNWNVLSSVNDTVGITMNDSNATPPANAALSSGTRNFSVTMVTGGSRTITATDITDGTRTANTSPSITILTGTFVGLQILVPGETAAPGTPTGKTGTPTARTAAVAFSVTVNAVDAYWNRVTTITDTVHLTSTDPAAVLAADAGLVNGTRTFTNGVTLKTVGNWTITASDVTDGAKSPNTSPLIAVNVGPFSKLQILVPGETAAPGSASGKTGAPVSQTAGVSLGITVNAVDANWYVINTITDTVAITSSDTNAILPANAALAAGTQNFTVTLRTGGGRTLTAGDVTDGSKTSNTSPSITVVANTFTKLQLLVPGETAAPGSASGKTGTPAVQRAGTAFSITVNAVDGYWNRVNTVTDTVSFVSNDPAATVPAPQALAAGTRTYTNGVNLRTVGNWTITATDNTDGSKTPNTSPDIPVVLGPFTKLQILVPGETAASGTPSGKTGTPLPQTAGVPFSVTVNAVDSNWYVINTVTDTVGITSSDVNSILPANAALLSGTGAFGVTLKTGGNRTITATDITDGSKTANTSPNINVVPNAFTKLQVLVPGEAAAPGTASGKTGTPTAQRAGNAINPVTVNAVDDYWNKVTTVTDVVHFTSDDPAGILPADQALVAGARTYTSPTLLSVGTWTLTVSDVTDGTKLPNTSSPIVATVGPFVKLQTLVPGETAAPGSGSGKTGTPAAQTAGVSFNVTVNAVDSNWYVINTVADTVGITSSDANAVLPASAPLTAGTGTYSVTLKTSGNRTVTASDITDGAKTANTSPNINVVPDAFTKLQVLAPGETAAPGTASGKTGAPTSQRAGTAINPVVVNAVDNYWNRVTTVIDTVHFVSDDPLAILPANQALVAGTRTYTSPTLLSVGTWTLTVSDVTDGAKSPNTSSPIPATVGPFVKLQTLAPGETAAPGSASGKTGAPTAQTAGVGFTVTVNAVDSNWYLINTVTDTVGITSSDANAILPANAALVGGTQTFGVTIKAAGTRTVTATDISDGTKTANTSSGITVVANSFTKMQILVPGETADPGSATGKTGTPTNLNASAAFNVTVNAVDNYWNIVPAVTDTVHLTSTDGTAILPADTGLVAGTGVRSVTFNSTPGPFTITLSDVTDGSKPPDTSAPITVVVGAFTKLQILVPGETAAPGSGSGKTGAPIAQTAGIPFNVTVNAVNANWYPIGSVTDTVRLTSTDTYAVLPTDTALAGGTMTFSVTLRTAGTRTITATDITDGTKTANASPNITVAVGAFTKLQIIVPGESAVPGSPTGKSGTPTARSGGVAFSITVNAVDVAWNRVTTVTHTVAITSSDPAATVPANQALAAGTRTYANAVTLRTPGTATLTVADVTDPSKTPDTSPDISVVTGPFSKLQILVPGETAAQGTASGKTGAPIAQTAGVPFTVTVNAVDANWYVMNTVTDTARITSNDTNAALPPDAALVAGTQTFSVTLKTGGTRTVTATDVTDGTKTANTSPSITVNTNVFTQLQLLVPGETAAPGTVSGKTGTPTARTAGTAFTVTANACDDYWNRVTTVTHTVGFASTDPAALLPANQALAAGTRTYTNAVTLRTAGTWTITIDDVTDGTKASDTSPDILVNLGPFSKLQILAPGETAAPGTASGKTGAPIAQTAGVPFDVVVNAVDSNWYLINSVTDTVGITSSDSNAVLPPNAALAAGTGTFSVVLKTGGTRTVTSSDITDGTKTANTSASITVNPNVFTKLQILVPGETAAPGTASGKTGAPTGRQAGTAFTVTVNAVDDYWNRVTTVTDTVSFDTSDPAATLPADQTLAAGTRTYTNAVTLRTTGNQTLTISDSTDVSKLSQTSPPIPVSLGAFTKLQVLTPGETASPGSPTGKTGAPVSQVAGVAFNVIVNAVDANWYVITSVTDTVGITSSDTNAILPPNAALTAGIGTFSVTLKTGGNRTVTSTDITDGTKTANTSPSIAVVPDNFTRLQLLVPGETAAPGTASGKTGSPTARTAGSAFTVTVNAVDDYWNRVTTVTDTVAFTSSDPAATLPAAQALAAGTRTYTNAVTLRTVGNSTLTITDTTDGSILPNTSPLIPVVLGPFSKLQILVPGQTAAPGTPTGKTGTPLPQTAGVPFTVTVNAVDSNWYLINTVTDTVAITSSDAYAGLPANAAFAGGTQTFSITLKTGGSRTVTATDVTDGTKTANTSSAITVGAASFVKLQILVPGETAVAGSPTGKTGTPTQQMLSAAFTVTVKAVDSYWNTVTSVTHTVHITSTDASATLPADLALTAGTRTYTNAVTLRTIGSWTLTAADVTDGSKLSDTSPAIQVVLGPFSKLQILVPGETAAPGTASGKTGTPSPQTAGVPFQVTVNAVNANWYLINTVTDTASITSSDVNAVLPPNAALVSGTQTFSVTLKTGGARTVTARDVTDATKTLNTSPSITVGAAAFVKLQILAPGETAAPGTVSGKTGTPTARTAGTAFTVTVNGVDVFWNRVTTAVDNINISSSDPNATLPANNVLAAGTRAFTVTLRTAGTATVTAQDLTDAGKTQSVTPPLTVNPGTFTKMQILVPGETASPGSTTGKTGTPSAQIIGVAFSITVNAVDANWNRVTTVGDTVAITSTDASAILPANTPLVGGTQTFNVTFQTVGNQTLTASDVTTPARTPNTSPNIIVGSGIKMQILVPGESAAPGSPSGKTGTPITIAAGTPFNIIANAVDTNWNVVTTVTDTVAISSTDGAATLPANTPLVNGTATLSVTFSGGGNFTLTLSDVTDAFKPPNTSPTITVIGEAGGTPGTALKWTGSSKDTLAWGAATNATSYNVYEGTLADLPNLLTASTDSCLRWSGTGTSTGPALTQPASGLTWYLVRAVNSGVEGSPGNASAGPRSLNSSGTCP